jgi:hypothetical protein
MTLVYVWIALSAGFALGWIARAALARRRGEEPSSPLQIIDLRTVSIGGSRRARDRAKSSKALTRTRRSSN